MRKDCRFCGGSIAALNQSFSICRSCSSIFNEDYRAASYSDSYFTDDYRNQYGKTYEEDFPSIYESSKRRMKNIIDAAETVPSSVLDVGAALGFFLKAADDCGTAEKTGVEISSFACEYMTKHFGYKCYQGSFEQFSSARQFDAVTAWYFIEHTPDIKLTLRRLNSFVSPGGVLAFAIPCPKGPAFTFNKKQWFETHPIDHSADLSPKAVKKILKDEGYVSIKIIPASFHPERVISKRRLIYPLFSFFYKLYSRLTAYSDTIEIYAVKR